MMESLMMEVRCCCQPQKLLGYLPVDEETMQGKKTCRVFAKKRVLNREWWRSGNGLTEIHDCVMLPIERISHMGSHMGYRESYFAIKAEGMTVEQLRELIGFQEAKVW